MIERLPREAKIFVPTAQRAVGIEVQMVRVFYVVATIAFCVLAVRQYGF